MSKVTALYHIVFATKNRALSIPMELREELYRFIWHEIKTTGSTLYRIGGVSDHVHMLVNLHPSTSLADLMRDVKSHAAQWMKADARFTRFDGWAKEYYACSVSPQHKDAVIAYIISQPQHHAKINFANELNRMFEEAGLINHPEDLK
ncbi:MAG: IS200/IS605 family transposase [Muribaculaceae bacterium]|nr:IS200/IS605 family transposase [Muribaculaceae bacterium]